MLEIILFLLFICIVVFPFPKFVIRHFFDMCRYGAVDLYYYIKHKEYNRCPFFGRVDIISAYRNKVFGSGKTLCVSKQVHDIYNKYNGLPVWDECKQAFVTQHIHIVSNVSFSDIPYTPFVTSRQLMDVEQPREDITIFVMDEIGAIWNSRDFKTNISTELLRNLLQVRKNKIYIIGTSQRFHFCDALLRQITANLVCVKKTWRIVRKLAYDPMDFENCNNIDMLKPLKVSCAWITNQDYASYDTDERVERLRSDDLLPDDQILINQGAHVNDLSASGLKRRYRRRRK